MAIAWSASFAMTMAYPATSSDELPDQDLIFDNQDHSGVSLAVLRGAKNRFRNGLDMRGN